GEGLSRAHPPLLGTRDDEAVVVAPPPPVAGAPALPVALEVLGDDPLRLGCRAAALEPEADQVHAEEPRLGRLLPGVKRLVADGDAALVHPLLEAPEPPPPATQHPEGRPRPPH